MRQFFEPVQDLSQFYTLFQAAPAAPEKRLSTVEVADRVLVVDAGRIVEDGPLGGRYNALHRSWLEPLA